MGDVWPQAMPGPDGADYGSVEFTPQGAFEVRSFQSFRLRYRVGQYGLDDTGAIKIIGRWTTDQGAVQFDDPRAINFVSATASNGVGLELHAERYPHQRPWYNGIRITVKRGYMRPGDVIELVLGDRSGGSPGFRLQTFPESAFEFRVLADPCATGVFLPVASPHIEIIPGSPKTWHLIAPTLRRPNEMFSVGIRAEDHWGNATYPGNAVLYLKADQPVEGLPKKIVPKTGARGKKVEGLSVSHASDVSFTLQDENGGQLAVSNPMHVREGAVAAYWGDLHGQSGETVGINPMRQYLEFARDVAFLDVTSHQANDFQITNAFWAEINRLSAEFNNDGRLTVFPGYEWSANTPLGGDHNVFFLQEGETIHRSSHALLTDRSDIGDDATNLSDLFAKLQGRDCVIYAHIGGRPAEISFDHDAKLRTAVEVHSDWGTFEWLMHDAFELGHRVGLVCNSDGHKGAPGACYPGASEFGAYSGLTCFLAEGLTRDAIFQAMRRRRHYGTTGCRMALDVKVQLGSSGVVFSRDPAVYDVPSEASEIAEMGDIACTDLTQVDVSVACHAHAPILRVDVLRGAELIHRHRPYDGEPLGSRLRVEWQGAEYRGRGRETYWTGELRLEGAQISRMKRINAWNPERWSELNDSQTVALNTITTGNFGGLDLWLDGPLSGRLTCKTSLVDANVILDDLAIDGLEFDAGGLDRKLKAYALPDSLSQSKVDLRTPVSLLETGDTPIWVRVTTEDGFVAWSSPIYLIKDTA
ncbi:MAG: DUF3604 domain-containing protein [Pseudomonadota bacterium]